MSTVINITDVHKSYRGGTNALNGISLRVDAGERIALLGPNGAGKSTLIRILTSLARADRGSVKVFDLDPARNFHSLMSRIGVCAQDDDVDPEEKGLNQLLFQARLFGLSKKEALRRTEELVETFDLHEHISKKAKDLSGGNRKRLHCALSLIHRPGLIFLDEPTTGMDPEIRNAFWESLTKVNRNEGTTLFFCTQYLEEAQRHAQRAAILLDGKLIFDDTVEALSSAGKVHGRDCDIEKSYLKLIRVKKNGEETHVA